MEILLVETDPLVRDQVKVGLQQFPEFNVTVGEGYTAINELRQRRYDCVFLGVDAAEQDGLQLLRHLRSFDRATQVVAVTDARHARDLASEKSRLDLTAFLHTPIRPAEFFRLVGRLRSRRLKDGKVGSR